MLTFCAIQAQTPHYKLGSKLWDIDSVGMFVVPPDADIVLAARLSSLERDSNLWVLDARTGTLLRKLRGPKSGELSLNPQSVQVSNDGKLCIVAYPGTIEDSSETTRAYDLTDGRLLWERKETAGIYQVSERLHRAMLIVVKYPDSSPSPQPQIELVDTHDGRTIRVFKGDVVPYTCFDEDQARFYLPFTRWQGQQAPWVVEFDAVTGVELRKWKALHGPMAKMPNRDSLYILTENVQTHDGQLRISRLDLNSGLEVIVTNCDVAKPPSCFQGSLPQLNVSEGEHKVFTSRTYQLGGLGALPVEIDVTNGEPLPLIMDAIFWEDKGVGGGAHYAINPSRGLFYFRPAGPGFTRRPLVCLNLNPFTSDVESPSGDSNAFTIAVFGNALHVQMNQQLPGLQRLEIVSMSGQIVLSRSINEGDAVAEIDLTLLPVGHYLCRLITTSGAMSKSFTIAK